jgi:hypothetical protein
MNRQLLVIAIVISCSAISVSAQAGIPKPDRDGNYFSNEAPVKGIAPSPLMRGSLWRVVSKGLNCRRGAGVNYGIVRQLKQNAILQAEVWRGGADEVLLNSKDLTGMPWMPVRAGSLRAKDTCYVRANSRYIDPVMR